MTYFLNYVIFYNVFIFFTTLYIHIITNVTKIIITSYIRYISYLTRTYLDIYKPTYLLIKYLPTY